MALAAAAGFHGEAAAQILDRYNTGQWVVQANASNGAFSNCTAAAPYGGGANVTFMLTNKMVWGISLTNPQWTWRVGSRGRVSYWIDGSAPHAGSATATTPQRLILVLADSRRLFEQIRAGDRMFFRPDGHNAFSMTLKGTSVALAELMGCVRKYR
ncbi:MAG: hypothetical protein BGP06_07405 [Rhizobiales bacterium 65-9]|nr:hypothetical protein [Hyphomicrobiales bacterium]OJY35635.1 MAG: hypothetical protein BGP06_07405 [Rhizobiales bacterium 65-9]